MPLQMFEEKKIKPLSRVKYIIGVAAGKGGVGKSTVTVNLARALQKKGLTVGVLDSDIYGPSLRRLLPEDQLPLKKGELIVPASSDGVRVISMAYFRGDGEAAVVRAPIANGVIGQFINQVDWGELDFLLIDFPPGTGDVQLTLAQQAQLSGAVMVTTPQELAVMDVRKAMNMFDQVQIPILGVVENMSYFLEREEKRYLFGRGGGTRLAAEVGVPFLGEIPIHPVISESADQGQSLFDLPAPELQVVLTNIAENMCAQLDPTESQGPIGYGFKQIDPYTFSLKGKSFRLSDLQKNCPCAGCVDERTGQRLLDPATVDDNVKAIQVQQVGRYGLKIQFTSGCSNGIYSFESLT